jgi:hypothetical protein
VIVATYGAAFAQTGESALVVGAGMLIVGLCLGPSARGEGARGIEDTGQVAEFRPRVVAGGLILVVARSVERFEGDDHFLAAGVPG